MNSLIKDSNAKLSNNLIFLLIQNFQAYKYKYSKMRKEMLLWIDLSLL